MGAEGGRRWPLVTLGGHSPHDARRQGDIRSDPRRLHSRLGSRGVCTDRACGRRKRSVRVPPTKRVTDAAEEGATSA